MLCRHLLQVQEELAAHGDIVFVQQPTDYTSILYKTFHVSCTSCTRLAGGPCPATSAVCCAVCTSHFRWHPRLTPAMGALLQVMAYAVMHYDVSFVLKTDDDAFINVPPLVQQLRALCETEHCRHERLYVGMMGQHHEVITEPGHRWNNEAFYNHTGVLVVIVFHCFISKSGMCRHLRTQHENLPGARGILPRA